MKVIDVLKREIEVTEKEIAHLKTSIALKEQLIADITIAIHDLRNKSIMQRAMPIERPQQDEDDGAFLPPIKR